MKRKTLVIIFVFLLILCMFLFVLRNTLISKQEAASSNTVVENVAENTEEKNETKKETQNNKTINHNDSKVGYLYGEELDNANVMINGVVPVCKDDMWALMSKEGKLITDFKYRQMETRYNEIILGQRDDPDSESGYIWCLIDENGNEITESIFLDQTVIPTFNKTYIAKTDNSKYIIVNHEGEILTEECDEILYDLDDEVYVLQKDSSVLVLSGKLEVLGQFDIGDKTISDFKDKKIIADDNQSIENKTIYNYDGSIDEEYSYEDERFSSVSDSMYKMALASSAFNCKIDFLSEEEINSFGLEGYNVSEGLLDGKYVKIGRTSDYTFGIYDKEKNEIILECKYDAIRYLGKGLFEVYFEEKLGIIDENLNEVVPYDEEIEDSVVMDENTIAVQFGKVWYLYNYEGNRILENPLYYSEIEPFNQDGLAPALTYKSEYGKNLVGFLDKDYNVAIGNFEEAKLVEETEE